MSINLIPLAELAAINFRTGQITVSLVEISYEIPAELIIRESTVSRKPEAD